MIINTHIVQHTDGNDDIAHYASPEPDNQGFSGFGLQIRQTVDEMSLNMRVASLR